MKLIEVNNVTYASKIHQQDENLPWLLMLHGFMGDHRVFDHLIDELCESCNPITIDLLGHGESSKPEDPERYTESKQVNDLYKIIQELDVAPLYLFGYSMGGRLALKTGLAAPEVLKGLILESTTSGINDNTKRKKRRQTDEKRAQEIESGYQNFLNRWEKLALFQSPLPINKELVQKYHNAHLDQDPKAMAASMRGFGTGSMRSAWTDIKQFDLPVLLIAGSEDEKYQRINNFLVNQFPNAKFSSVQGGHRTHLDNPEGFLSELKNYIDINTLL